MTRFEYACKSPENLLEIAGQMFETGMPCTNKPECAKAIDEAKDIFDMPNLNCNDCFLAYLNAEMPEEEDA